MFPVGFPTIHAWLSGIDLFLSHLLNWHPFGVLALLPGLVALLNQLSANSHFDRTKKEADTIAETKKNQSLVFVKTGSDLEDYRPRMTYTVLGALLLTLVFELVAGIGGVGRLHRHDLGAAGPWPETVGASEELAAKNKSELPKTDAAAPPAVKSETAQANPRASANDRGASQSESAPTVKGLAGLVYAGYGAYIYTLILVISRLNSSALTGKFLAVSSVRSAIALILGFTAAETNIFSGLSSNQALFVLFFIGLFPSWAIDAVRSKAQAIFKPSSGGCDILPICLIDGLDDGIADRLAEIGIWDIQHIASSNPFVLAAKTLFPIRRVVDWMDQALLISYIRGLIVHFRAIGVRGAIDFAALYRDAIKWECKLYDHDDQEAYHKMLADRASEIIKVLSQKTGLSEACLNVIGRSLYEDAVVKTIWDLWDEEKFSSDGKQWATESTV